MHKKFVKMYQKDRKTVNILNVKIDSTSKPSVLRYVRARLAEFEAGKAKITKFLIVTPNPEQVMRAQNDEVFMSILNSADLSIPDGIGLIAAHKFLNLPVTENLILKPFLYLAQGLGVGFSIIFDRDWLTKDLKVIRGRELFMELIKLANKKGWREFLLGDRLHSARKAVEALKKSYKGVKLIAADGPNLDADANTKEKTDVEVESEAIGAINKANPRILFVGFGAPIQEKWLYRHWSKLNFGGAMVLGGTFDYVSGKKRFPPKWIESSNLEWLWRLLTKDQKVNRILTAFPQFALSVFTAKLRQNPY